MIKNINNLHSFKEWLFIFFLLAIATFLLPLLNIFAPEESVLHVPDYIFPLLGKYLCYALIALAIDLIWGYTGILSLGHGVFFSMGGYAMGMYLMRSIGKEGVYKSDLPDFMVFLDWKELPEGKASRILIRENIDPNNRDDWEKCYSWYVNKTVKFKKAFIPLVKTL